MERLAEKLSKYVFMKRFMSLEEVKELTLILDSYFHDKIYNGIEELNASTYPMFYYFSNNKIYLVYKALKDEISNAYKNKRYYQYLDFVSFFNISIIIFLFHEFRHSMQAYEIKNKSSLGILYQKSLDFISRDVSYYSVVVLAMYKKFHDYFPIEINADYCAFLWLIDLLDVLQFDKTSIFENLFFNKIECQYNFREYDFFHREVLKDIAIIEELSKNLSDKDKILNGIVIPDPKKVNIRELLVS